MAERLRYTLIVRHPDTLVATPLIAGSEVPDWASDLVHADDVETEARPAKAAASKSTKS